MSGPMSIVFAAIATGVAVLMCMAPAPSRRRARARALRHREVHLAGSAAWARAVDAVGSRARRWLRRPADAAADRRAGFAVTLALSGAMVHPIVAAGLAALPFAVDLWWRRQRRRRAESALVAELPDVIDLFRVAAGAGLTVHHAIDAVRNVSDEPIAGALEAVHRRVIHGERLTDALPELLSALGEPMRPLVSALVSAERDGAPLRLPLERAAEIARDVRRRRAEESARRVPVQLLFPLVACVLPAFALLTVVPLLAGTLQTLSL